MAGGSHIIVELDHDQFSAVQVVVAGGKTRVKSWTIASRPQSIDVGDTGAMGAWIADCLRDANIGRSRVTLSLSRRDVVLKRLTLPGASEVGRADLTNMVSLQMTRQLTVALDGTAFDYLVLPSGGSNRDAMVLAGALPGERLEWCQALCRAAGLKVRRITLRAFGSAALVGASPVGLGETVIVIAASPASVEFLVIDGGSVAFVRSADIARLAPNADYEAQVRRIAVEAKRTWMSYRVSRESGEIDRLVVLGDDELAQQTARVCSESLDIPADVLGPASGVELPKGLSSDDASALMPLIGLASLDARAVLDFAHPRKAPDTASSRRQLAMLTMLGLIVLGGGGYVLGDGELSRLRSTLKGEKARRSELSAQYGQLYAEQARLEHMKQWASAQTDWLAHLAWISEHLPDPAQGQLDTIRASVAYEPAFVPDGKGAISGDWPTRRLVNVTLNATAKVPGLLAQVRESLLADSVYQVDTIGPDAGNAIHLNMRSTLRTPQPEIKSPDAEGTP